MSTSYTKRPRTTQGDATLSGDKSLAGNVSREKQASIQVIWDDSLCEDPEAMVIGAIRQVEQSDEEKSAILDSLPKRYHRFTNFFASNETQPLLRRRTFDHAIELQPDTTAPWGLIYALSERELGILPGRHALNRQNRTEQITCGRIYPIQKHEGPNLYVDYQGRGSMDSIMLFELANALPRDPP